MRKLVVLFIGLGLLSVTFSSLAAGFEDDFTGLTVRLDYYHTGNASEETFSLDRFRVEGPWPGSRTRLLDHLNLGKYMVEVVDAATNRLLYSRGFASIYGEWETTGPALEGTVGTFEESVRFPEPKGSFQVRLRKRGNDGLFREVWTVEADPSNYWLERPPIPSLPSLVLEENGDPSRKVDLLILGDGYTGEEQEAFFRDAGRLTEALFALEPYASRRSDFNVRAVVAQAAESGVTQPRARRFVSSPLGFRYNIFDSERYVLTLDDRAWREAASSQPYDFVAILVNSRQYGGGGIFGLYATVAAGSGFSDYIFVHELGHHMVGLADEYYTSDVAYDLPESIPEPWERNATAETDPTRLKWARLVAEGTPIPTPWGKEAFEEASQEIQSRRRALRSRGAPEEELEALFLEERALLGEMLRSEEHAGEVGLFEGAGYMPKGLYRGETDCIMFTRRVEGFCRVCRGAIEEVLDQYVK